jgi:CheY-like chemotaxis protein
VIAYRASILITDDDFSFREALQGVFEPERFRTLLAGDGEEALDILRREPVHLLLLDMHMPRLSGLETIRRVKQFNALLPCILMSANADELLVQQALLAQAFAVLNKPVSRSQIIQKVQLALDHTYNWPSTSDKAGEDVSHRKDDPSRGD